MQTILKMSAFRLSVTLLSVGFVGAISAHADDMDEIVSTATRSDRPSTRQAGNIDVFSTQELSLVGATHFSELAVRTAGVNFARNDGQEYLASIRSPIFTGAGACGAFLVAQDGIALRSSGFCNVNEMFEAFTEQAQRIEITKGPGSALYGSNALHGIINVVSPSADTNAGLASLELGANGFARLNISKGWLGERSGVLATGSFTHDGGYRDQSGYGQQKMSLRHDFHGSKWDVASSLSLTNLEQETAGYIVGLDAYKDKAVAKSNPNPEAFRNAKSLRYWSRLSTDIGESTRLQLTPYARVLDMEFLMHFLPGQPLEENSQKSLGLQSGLYFNEGSDFEIITGVDVEYTRGSLQQTQALPTQGSAFLRATIPTGKQYDYDVDSFMVAAFVQTDWAVTPKLHVLAGARLEYIGYDYTNNMVSGRTREDGTVCGFGGCRYSRPDSRKDNFTAISPKLSLLYNYDDDHTAYVNLGSGFRAPQATELYRLQRAQTIADLDKVNLQNAEFGFRGQNGGFSYDLSVYAMKKDNVIFRDSSFFNVDNGTSDHIGADIMMALALSEHLSVRGNAGFARHRYTSDTISGGVNLNGKDIDTSPHHFGSAQVNWRPTDAFTAELEWVHMGPYFLNPENTHSYEGHDYLNLRSSYDVSDQYQIFMRVMNVTNTAYAERADSTTFTGERYFPGKPRSLYVGVRAKF
ncbi:MAG: TonB-dependent receptor [Robiginitomaculum sp.]|nr:MAG: TonB-dependent receptor [Robiginitomaculum sp.]